MASVYVVVKTDMSLYNKFVAVIAVHQNAKSAVEHVERANRKSSRKADSTYYQMVPAVLYDGKVFPNEDMGV